MSYALALQTISTFGGLVGVGVLVYVTFIAQRLHKAVKEVPRAVAAQTTDLKQSIERQTSELSQAPAPGQR